MTCNSILVSPVFQCRCTRTDEHTQHEFRKDGKVELVWSDADAAEAIARYGEPDPKGNW